MEISEDKFYEEYKPQKNHLDDNASYDGCMYETYGDELDYVFNIAKKENRVWTIIEGDEGTTIVAGFHYVNRLGFLVTEKWWDNDDDYVEEEDLTEDTTIDDAIDTLHNALTSYIEDCAGEGSEEADEIEEAWRLINGMVKKEEEAYYELRHKGDGEFDYFVVDPENNGFQFDPQKLNEVRRMAELAPELLGHPVWIVKISETRL